MISTIGERAWGRVECKFRQRKKNENIGPAKWLDLVKNSGSVSRSARQAPVFMGFSRQESWSGQPLPSPGALPHPKTKPRSPALQADSSTSEPRGKPKNPGVGSLSLLQGIFPSQGSNQGSPALQAVLHRLSHEGSPVYGAGLTRRQRPAR